MLDLGASFVASVARDPDVTGYCRWRPSDDLRTSGTQGFHLSSPRSTRSDLKAAITLSPCCKIVGKRRRCYWACQFTGIIITPINWRANADELDYCTENAEAEAVIFQQVSAEAVEQSKHARGVRRIAVGEVDMVNDGVIRFDEISNLGASDATPRADACSWSIMLYTSGTTGKAKGVPRRHRHERASASRTSHKISIGMASERSASCRSITRWACVHCSRWRWSRPVRLRAALECGARARTRSGHKLTCLYLVPTLYHDLARRIASRRRNVSVTKLGFAGAPMNDGLLKRLSGAFKPELFVNHYGVRRSTRSASTRMRRRSRAAPDARVSIRDCVS